MGDIPITALLQTGEARAAIVEAIARSAESLLASSLDDCGPVVLRMIGEAAGAEAATIWSYSPDNTRHLAYDWTRVERPGPSPVEGLRDEDITGTPAEVPLGGVIVVPVADLNAVTYSYVTKIGIAWLARVSIVVGGRSWGELTMGYGEGLAPSLSERDSLRTAASCIAGAIELSGVKQSLARRDAILAGVAGVAELLIQGRPLDDAMPDALALIAGASGARRAALWEHLPGENNSHGGRRRWHFTRGVSRPLEPEEVEVESAFFDSVRRGEVVVINRDGVDAIHRRLLSKADVAQVLVVPIFAAGHLWGALSQSFTVAGERSPGEIDAIRAAASIFGGALQAGANAIALTASEERVRQSEKLEAVGRLAGGVAHDFNNLLTAILGYADLLYDATGSEDARQIVAAATRAASLTRQLLALSRSQELRTDAVDLGSLAREVAELVERVIGEDIVVEVAIDPNLGLVMADPGQIHQVLLNLAFNGRDAMPNGGHLRISAESVDPTPQWLKGLIGSARVVCLTVQDDGVGMDHETRERAFEPFFTTKPAGVGTGLGLSTVHGIVRASGGDVTIESQLGEGATVRVWLPRVDRPAFTVSTEHGSEDTALIFPIRPGAVALVVEDDEVVRTFAQKTLERAGMRVVVAADPISALRRAREESRLDVLVTDVVMPIMSGHELATHIGKIYPEAVVLLISGYPTDDVLPSADELVGFLAKPFAAEDLVEAVRSMLVPVLG